MVSEFFAPVRNYLRETIGELRKVHWPSWPEARNLTAVVLAVMVVMALFLGFFDLVFGELMIRVLKQEIIFIGIAVFLAVVIIVLVLFAGKERR